MKVTMRKTRRKNGDGSIYFYNSYWCCKKWTTLDGVKKRVTIYAKSMIELMQKYINRFGEDVSNSEKFGMSFNEYFLYWLINVKSLIVSSTTLKGNITIFNNYIKDYFKDIRICQITNDLIIAYFKNVRQNEISNNTFRKIKFLLNQFFNYLQLSFKEFKYPFILKSIKAVREDNAQEYKALPVEIREKFIKSLDQNKTLKIICFLGLYAGLRIGEILALTWDNIDFDKKIIKIRASIRSAYKFNDKGKVIDKQEIVGTTKSECSLRDVPMPEKLYKFLYDYKKEMDLLNHLTNKTGSGNIFGLEKLRSYSGTRKLFDRFLVKNGFKEYNIHFHTLRHTYATILLEKDVNPKIVQFLLGHRSVKTTLDIYNNVLNCRNEYQTLINNVFA